jgi:hypothetical protein
VSTYAKVQIANSMSSQFGFSLVERWKVSVRNSLVAIEIVIGDIEIPDMRFPHGDVMNCDRHYMHPTMI